MSWPKMDSWRLERVLRLACLLDSGMRATPEELAKQLGIKRRMFFLDLVLLIRLGYTAQYSRKLGRYELIEPDAGIPPHEIYALARGVAAMAKIDGPAHEAVIALEALHNAIDEMADPAAWAPLSILLDQIVSRAWQCPVARALAIDRAINEQMMLAVQSSTDDPWEFFSPCRLEFNSGRLFLETSHRCLALDWHHAIHTAPFVMVPDARGPAEAQGTAGSAGGKKQNTDMSPGGAGAQT